MPTFFCKASLNPRKGMGVASHGSVTPKDPPSFLPRPSPWSCLGTCMMSGLFRKIGYFSNRVFHPLIPDTHRRGCLSLILYLFLQRVFGSSLGRWRWPCPLGSWHFLSPDALPTRHQIMENHFWWEEAARGLLCTGVAAS